MKPVTTTLMALALVLAIAPAATADDVQNQRFDATLLFAEGGTFDEETGSSTYVAYEAVKRVGEPAELFVHGLYREPLDCFEGASDILQFSAQGPASLDVTGRFDTATVTATLDTVFDSFNDCTEESDTRIETGVPYGMDLAGDGPVLRERKYDSSHVPSENEFHQQAHSVGRQATGSLTAGDDTIEVLGGFVGRTYGTFHIRPALEGLTSLALAADALNEGDRIKFAELGWAEEGELEYHDRVLGAFRGADGETVIEVGGIDAVTDPDAGCAVTTFMEGFGPGTVTFGSHMTSATGTGVVDMYVAVVDECTGDVQESFLKGVPVTLDATAGGPVFNQTHVQTLLVPGEYHSNQRTQVSSRDGAGTFSIDGTAYDAFASIGRARLRMHETTA